MSGSGGDPGVEPLAATDPRTVGDFRVRARLGDGGMGRVYLATSPAGRMVAVKVVHPELARDDEFIRRFRAEVDSAKRVSGMYTAPVVAAGVDGILPWLATGFVPGPSLGNVVDRFGPLPVAALWRLAAGLAEALRAIHSVSLVHRDLKPGNVLLAADGPRVIDFGISRTVTERRVTVTGAVIGTPGYMSPEQVEGQLAGPQSDMFSFGCVLAFAASGSSPFSSGAGNSLASALYRVVHAEPDLGGVPAEVRELITACLAKDPARRPGAGQVAATCAAASEYVGVSPAVFWPDDVAGIIQAQQAALTAQLQELQLPSTPVGVEVAVGNEVITGGQAGEPDSEAGTHPGTAFSPAVYTRTDSGASSASPASEAPTVPGSPTVRHTRRFPGPPSRSGGLSRQPPHPGPDPRFMRRRVLLGVGAAGVVLGVSAWAVSGKSSPPARAGQRTAGDQGPPGTLAWTFRTGFRVNANPVVVNGTVYFGSGDSRLYAVGASTGRKVWSLLADPATAAPTVGRGILCVSATQGNFYAVHAASGRLAWHLNGNQLDNYQRNWAIDGRYVALARGDMTVQMNDVASGVQRWTATTLDEGGYTQTIAASGGVVYAVSRPGALHALNAATGREIYRVQLLRNGASPSTNLIISGDTMYLGSDGGLLYAIHPKTGKVRWTYQLRGRFPQSDPIVGDGIVYVNDNLSTLHAVDASSGVQVWTYDDNGGDAVSPAVADGCVYIPARIGLQKLNAKTGEPGWTFNPGTGGQFFSTPVVAGGLIFLGCDDHRVYAIRAG